MKKAITLFMIFSTLLVVPPAWSYTQAPVTDGGNITGKVLLKGEKPPPKAFNLVTYPEPEFCGRISTGTVWRLLDEFQVSSEGGLQNVVMILEGVRQGKPFAPTSPAIEVRDCTFSLTVMVVQDNNSIKVVNMDPVIHDVQVYETAPFGSEVVFHRPLRMNPYHSQDDAEAHDHLPGEPLIDTIQFSKGRRIFYLECGFHEFMQAWGIAVNNPYYAITDEQGTFTITDIPEGVYTLVAWHPGMGGILDMKVVVLSDDTLKVRFEFDAPKDTRSAHTTMVENPHFGPEPLGIFGEEVNILPTHEVQTP